MPITDNLDDVWTHANGEPFFYDRAGTPISANRYLHLSKDRYYKVLNETKLADCTVITVWLGSDQGSIFDQGERPWIFGTIVRQGDQLLDHTEIFADSEDAALRNHDRAVLAQSIGTTDAIFARKAPRDISQLSSKASRTSNIASPLAAKR